MDKYASGSIKSDCRVDAIVNAARPSLLGGGGIDKVDQARKTDKRRRVRESSSYGVSQAIHARAGPKLKEVSLPFFLFTIFSCRNVRHWADVSMAKQKFLSLDIHRYI